MQDYLKISRASDLQNEDERALYRFFEMLPGLMSWGTIVLFIFLSIIQPMFVASFVIIFDLYWFFKTIFFSFHLRKSYLTMKRNEKIDWVKKNQEEYPDKINNIHHLIVIPMYNEPLAVVRESFQALMATDYDKSKFIVVLACEEKARKDTEETAKIIEQEFGKEFCKFLVTWHPFDIIGELAGKASNETWGARIARQEINNLGIEYENIIFTSLDVDTVVAPKYFSCLTYYYLSSDNPTRYSYQPIPLFVNNLWESPAVSRIFSFSTTFWQLINQERENKLLTFSSHSMSFKALVDVDFKQTNVVSDDSRIFWQCFLKYNGEYSVQPIYYPVSMDANSAETLTKTLQNIYKQQRRWAYGTGDIPYFLFNFLKNKKIPLAKKLSWGREIIEGHWSWACASIIIFVLLWFPLILGGEVFQKGLIAHNLPRVTSYILTVSMLGLLVSAYYNILLIPKDSPKRKQSFLEKILIVLQWITTPLIMVFFTSVPAIDAQTRLMMGNYMGFWVTPKSRK